MRITTNGQVTIPKAIREALGLLPRTEVDFIVEGESVRIVKADRRAEDDRGARLVQRLRAAGPITMSTDEIMALTRGEDA